MNDLKALLREHNISAEGCIEKRDLVEALTRHFGADGADAKLDEQKVGTNREN